MIPIYPKFLLYLLVVCTALHVFSREFLSKLAEDLYFPQFFWISLSTVRLRNCDEYRRSNSGDPIFARSPGWVSMEPMKLTFPHCAR